MGEENMEMEQQNAKFREMIQMYIKVTERNGKGNDPEYVNRGIQALVLRIITHMTPSQKTHLCLKFSKKWPALVPNSILNSVPESEKVNEDQMRIHEGLSKEIESNRRTISEQAEEISSLQMEIKDLQSSLKLLRIQTERQQAEKRAVVNKIEN
jgi:uncharacterized coiled-coil DUF342 family protein